MKNEDLDKIIESLIIIKIGVFTIIAIIIIRAIFGILALTM
jgi:hypothetical protein